MKKIIGKENARRLWRAAFGDALWAQDCFGTWMYREDYGKRGELRDNRPGNNDGHFYRYGWVVDLILPIMAFIDKSEALLWDNLEPMNYGNAKAKGKRTDFLIMGKRFLVVKYPVCSSMNQMGYGIMEASSSCRVDWKYCKRRSHYIGKTKCDFRLQSCV